MSKVAKYLGVIVFGVCFLSFQAVALPINLNQVPASIQKAPTLFIIIAKHGEVEKIANSNGKFRLVMKGVDPRVLYFTERPVQFSNAVNMQKFINRWHYDSFNIAPPNAAIQGTTIKARLPEGQGKDSTYVVELTNPKYNKVNNTLSFDIKPLATKHIKLQANKNLKNVALFIDECGGCF